MAAVGLYFAAVCNQTFFRSVANTGAFDVVGGWTLAGCLFLAIAAMHVLILSIIPGRIIAKAALSLLILGAVVTDLLASRNAAYVDAVALRSLLVGDTSLSMGGPSWSTIVQIGLLAGLPIAAVWWVRLAPRPWALAAVARASLVVAASVFFLIGVTVPGHRLDRLRYEHQELSQLLTPLNLLAALMTTRPGEPPKPRPGPVKDSIPNTLPARSAVAF